MPLTHQIVSPGPITTPLSYTQFEGALTKSVARGQQVGTFHG